jgi:hypothetical protein
MSDEALHNAVRLLLVAGIDTTWSVLTSALLHLARDHGLRSWLASVARTSRSPCRASCARRRSAGAHDSGDCRVLLQLPFVEEAHQRLAPLNQPVDPPSGGRRVVVRPDESQRFSFESALGVTAVCESGAGLREGDGAVAAATGNTTRAWGLGNCGRATSRFGL